MTSSNNNLWEKSATEVVSLLKNKEISSEDALNSNLKRINETHKSINAVITLCEERARKQIKNLNTKNKELEKEVPISVWADYVILDLKKPWFIVTQGCHWIRGKCFEDKQGFSNNFSRLVEKTKEQFDTIYENDSFMILKNRSS